MVSAFRRIRAPMQLSNLVLFMNSFADIWRIAFLELALSFLEVLQTSTPSESLLVWLCLSLGTAWSHGSSEGALLGRWVRVAFSITRCRGGRPPAAASPWFCACSSTMGGCGGGSPSNFRRGGVSPGAESGHLGSLGAVGGSAEILGEFPGSTDDFELCCSGPCTKLMVMVRFFDHMRFRGLPAFLCWCGVCHSPTCPGS
mmetsp:Transcript_22771/g.72097  ORF Transcript_22771/g.72097 Transcript_22771/m.72097 type:complete len:200 (+) Transcript_22771:214-813(+)